MPGVLAVSGVMPAALVIERSGRFPVPGGYTGQSPFIAIYESNKLMRYAIVAVGKCFK
jgi:hypothetical protein